MFFFLVNTCSLIACDTGIYAIIGFIYHMFCWEKVVDVQHTAPPVINTTIAIETILNPVWAIVEVSHQAYIKHHEQHIWGS